MSLSSLNLRHIFRTGRDHLMSDPFLPCLEKTAFHRRASDEVHDYNTNSATLGRKVCGGPSLFFS